MENKLFVVEEITDEQAEVFNNYFCENGSFNFEGCWLRNQRKENQYQSNYVDETTRRRRYVHFYDTYVDSFFDGKHHLALSKYYLYVTNTLPKEEIAEYESRIMNALKLANYKKIDDEKYLKDNGTMVVIKRYNNHPENTEVFPENYTTVDIVVASDGYDYSAIQDRMWKLSRKMYRMPDKRGNPKYTKDMKDILEYLPAQVEMGCGPSIGANIPPLHEMHETYRVQNHINKKFYFAKEDDLIENVIKDELKMRKIFAKVPIACISAKITEGYYDFKDLYEKGFFKGIVYNNNFDRIVKRLGIPEHILRIYDINEYIARPKFEEGLKSLVCIGCHADRRQVERQAREKGLKIIFIDPEGFYEKDGFVEYKIEGPKDDDIIVNITFEEAMKQLGKLKLQK